MMSSQGVTIQSKVMYVCSRADAQSDKVETTNWPLQDTLRSIHVHHGNNPIDAHSSRKRSHCDVSCMVEPSSRSLALCQDVTERRRKSCASRSIRHVLCLHARRTCRESRIVLITGHHIKAPGSTRQTLRMGGMCAVR